MNKVIEMGRLTADPELIHSPNGTVYTRFSIAVNRRGAKEGQQQADFIPCVAFGKTAEFITKYFSKGRMIMLEGSLQQNVWEENGKKHTAYNVSVFGVEFTGEKKDDSGNPYQSQSNNNESQGFMDLGEANENDLPF